MRKAVIHSQMNHSFKWNLLSDSAPVLTCGLNGSFTNDSVSVSSYLLEVKIISELHKVKMFAVMPEAFLGSPKKISVKSS